MNTDENKVTRTSILLALSVIGLVAILAIIPAVFKTSAGNRSENGRNNKTVSHEDGIENYDIRTDKSKSDMLFGFRLPARKNALEIADVRDRFVAGEDLLRQKVPTLKVEYNEDIRTPEVIAPDVEQGRAFLTDASTAKPSSVLRQFISDNNSLVGVEKAQVNQLKTTADYTNPDGNLSYAHLEQTINGVPVFRGEIKAGFTKDGEMFRVINNLAPGLDYDELSTDFGDPSDAVKAAAANINYELKDSESNQNYAVSSDLKAVFGTGDWATTAEKMYFPTEPGVARTAWRVLIWKPTNAYYVILDAETGTMLWRKNISSDQTQAATYNVYSATTNMLRSLNSPAPIVPGLNAPTPGTQGAVVPRSNVTLVGNESPNTFNNLGWMNDNINGVNGTTDGNNVQAGLDIDGTNGVDATVNGTNRTFNFAYNPAPGNPAPGDAPTLPAYRNGAVTQLFYLTNRYHDELYKLGFTEQARNFQNDNFGRGGSAADRVSAESQDSSGTNNANFGTPADGGRGRMQMYIFSGPNPDYDGDLDADIVTHELTHGTSNRLIGNGGGLSGNRSGSMGEGWSDFYGLSLLTDPNATLAANYVTGGYATYLLTSTYTYNYYYGIRRFPYAIKSFTGGPNNRSHNPLTFADIDPAQANLTDGAYAANPVFAGNSATEVHNAGEVWAVALWEVRAQFINRLGGTAGNLKALQLVTDGMKLTPLSPNFIQARDAVISAATATAAADVVDVREGFRIRGMGFGAQDNSPAVVESFAVPNVEMTDPFSVNDAPGNNNGFAEPGENVLLNVAIINKTGATVNNVSVNVNGGTNVSYGSITNSQTVTRQIPYQIPANTPCGSLLSVTINISSDAGTLTPQTRSIRVGTPVFGSAAQNFDGVTAPALPVGWTQTKSGANTGWVTTTTNAVSAPNSVFAPDPSADGEAILETSANITSASAQLSFSNRFNTEDGYDGTVLEVKVGSGAYQDILAAGGSFVSGGYTKALLNTTPLGARQAWTGVPSPNPVNTVVNLPAAANGQTIGLRWRTVSDSSVAGTGTYYDNMQLTGGNFLSSYACPTYEADVQSRPIGDGFIDSDDIQQIRAFSVGSGTPYQLNEFQRADASPRSTGGDGVVDGDDVQQTRRYSVGTDAKQLAVGPTTQAPIAPPVSSFENGTVSPTIGKSIVRKPDGAQAAPSAFRIDAQNTSAGTTLTVPIRVDTVGNEAGYTFSIAFDSTKLTNPSVVIGNSGGDVLFNANNPGQIGFSVTTFSGGTIAAGNNKTLVTVTFTVAAGAAVGTTPITFTDTPARRKASPVDPNFPITQPTYMGGTITIGGATAAGASFAGRVLTADGRGLMNAVVKMTDTGGVVRTTRTTSFGYYHFDDVETGRNYVLAVESKRFQFTSRLVSVTDNLSEINFTGYLSKASDGK